MPFFASVVPCYPEPQSALDDVCAAYRGPSIVAPTELPPPLMIRTADFSETRCVAMSGRVRVTLSDGRRVTGFRKTLRVNKRIPRTPDWQLPDWRLSVVLPDDLAFAFSPGLFPGIIGVTIGKGGLIEVVGKSKNWVIGQVVSFLQKVAKDRPYRKFRVCLVRAPEQNPTISGPSRPGETVVLEIELRGGRATVVGKTAMRVLSA